jgi:hypothetical protein
MSFLDGNLYLGGSINIKDAKKHRQNRYIPVIAKVDYDFTTFHWAYKREDSDGLWQYTVDLMESHYTSNTAVIYAVSRYRTEHNSMQYV